MKQITISRRTRVKRIIYYISNVIFVVSFFYMVGIAGSLDCDAITIHDALVYTLYFLVAISVAYYLHIISEPEQITLFESEYRKGTDSNRPKRNQYHNN